jgi:hypothetical protein
MSTSEILSAAPPAAAPPAGDGAPPAGSPPAAAPPAPTAPAWLTGADETTVGYVANKGWTEPKQVLEGYRNLEKLLGADKAGNAVILPKADATADEQAAFFSRLGRPADPAGYKIEVPAGGDPEFAKQAGAWFHELGLTQKQGEALAGKWNEHIGGMGTAAAAAQAQALAADDAALKTAWGSAFAQNVAQAQVGMRAIGGPEMVDKLSSALGHKATMEFLQSIGARTGEAPFESGQTAVRFGDALTPAQAKSKITELRQDKAFVAKYISKDGAAVAEMARLHAFAYPDVKD